MLLEEIMVITQLYVLMIYYSFLFCILVFVFITIFLYTRNLFNIDRDIPYELFFRFYWFFSLLQGINKGSPLNEACNVICCKKRR
jgi:hypothetical protein